MKTWCHSPVATMVPGTCLAPPRQGHFMNYDEEEVKKFEAYSSEWWDKQGPFATLHHLNPTRLQFINDNTLLSGKRVIDIGCGAGILSESLAQRGAFVTGLDASASIIEVAKLHAESESLNIHYEFTTAEQYATQFPECFDVVVCMELLEHVPDPQSLIRACRTLLAPGGILFFSTLNRNLKSYLFAIVGAEYILGILPKNTHQYEKLIKPSELSDWLLEVNCSIKNISGLKYNPFTKEAYLDKDVSINYLIAATPF